MVTTVHFRVSSDSILEHRGMPQGHLLFPLQLLPEYQVAHERAVFKAIAIVGDTKKIVQDMNIESLSELRAMSKPIIDIEDLMAAIIMICKCISYFP